MEKTRAKIKNDIHQSDMKKDDVGYIDGYVRGGDGRPYAVFIRNDGAIDMVSVYSIRALLRNE